MGNGPPSEERPLVSRAIRLLDETRKAALLLGSFALLRAFAVTEPEAGVRAEVFWLLLSGSACCLAMASAEHARNTLGTESPCPIDARSRSRRRC